MKTWGLVAFVGLAACGELSPAQPIIDRFGAPTDAGADASAEAEALARSRAIIEAGVWPPLSPELRELLEAARRDAGAQPPSE